MVVKHPVFEYVEETSFATFPTNPAMQAVEGDVEPVSVEETREIETLPYLAEQGASNKAEALENVETTESIGIDVDFVPTALPAFVQYALGGTTGTADSLSSLALGFIDEGAGEYKEVTGAKCESAELTLPVEAPADVSMSFVAADASDWTTSDYVGTGSHASKPAGSGIAGQSVTSVQIDTGAGYADIVDYVEELVISIEHTLGIAKDLNSTNRTAIEAAELVRRDVTLEVTATLDDPSLFDDLRSTINGIQFTVGGSTWTLSTLDFPDIPKELTAEDLLAESFESAPVPGQAIAIA